MTHAPVARLSVYTDGSMKLNDVLSEMAAIEAELKCLQSVNGEVWYYRENPLIAAHPNANRVFDLILEHRLTVMLASKPDFSEYFDKHGQSWPRDQAKRREAAFTAIAKKVNKLRMAGAAFAFMVGLAVAIPRTIDNLEASDMLAHGIPTNAVVIETNRWVREGTKGREFVDYTLAYEFVDKTGTKFQNSVSYTPSGFTPINKGDAIRIVYNSQHPEKNERREHYERLASIRALLTDVFLVMGSVLVLVLLMTYLAKRKLKVKATAELCLKSK